MAQTIRSIFEGDTSHIEAAAKAAQEAINGISEAEKKLAAEVQIADAALKAKAKTLGLTTSQLKDVEEGAKRAATGAGKLADGAGKAGSSAGKLAGALSLVSPAAGEATRNVADLADVAELAGEAGAALGVSMGTLAVTLGVVTAAVGVGYLAWKEYHREEEEAKEASDRLSASLKALQPIHSLVASSALDVAHAQGRVSDAEYEYQKALESASAAKNQSIAEAKKQVAENQQLLDGMGSTARTLDGVLVPSAQKYTDAIREGNAVLDSAERAYGEVEKNLRAVRDATIAAESAEERAKRETLERKAAAESFIQAVHDLIDSENEEFKLSKERAKIAEANAKIIADAEKESAERREEAEYELWARQQGIEADRAEMYKKGIEDRKELELEYAESAAAIWEESLSLVQDIAERELDARTETIETLQDELAAGEETLTEDQKAALEERIAANKEAAVTAFNVAKAVAAAQAVVSTALAVVNALASPVPYPVAVGFAVAAGIAGAAEIATILSEPEPTFHTGGVFMPDEGSATLRAGEGVTTPETTRNLGGAPGIAELNRTQGRSLMGGRPVLRIGRREVAEIERTGVRARGPMSRRIRKEVRRGPLGVGRSGKGVPA